MAGRVRREGRGRARVRRGRAAVPRPRRRHQLRAPRGGGARLPLLPVRGRHRHAAEANVPRRAEANPEQKGGGGGAEEAPVREGPDAERRREAEPAGDPEAPRGEALAAGGGQQGRQGRGAELRGRARQGVAVPLLVLEEHQDSRADQGMELVREGEGAPGRRRGDLPPLHRRRREATLHLRAQAARDAGGCHSLLQVVWC